MLPDQDQNPDLLSGPALGQEFFVFFKPVPGGRANLEQLAEAFGVGGKGPFDVALQFGQPLLVAGHHLGPLGFFGDGHGLLEKGQFAEFPEQEEPPFRGYLGPGVGRIQIGLLEGELDIA